MAGATSAGGWGTAAAIVIASMMNAYSQAQTNQMSADEAHNNRVFQSIQADRQRAWLENMSNTAHQREVKDLIASGLNPILSANGGASTPSAGMPTGAQASYEAPELDANAISNAMTQTRALNQRQQQIPYENEKTWQEANLLRAQTNTEAINAELKARQVLGEEIRNQLSQKDLDNYDKKLLTELSESNTRQIENIANANKSRAERDLTLVEKYRKENTPLYVDKYGIKVFGNGLDFTVNKGKGKEPKKSNRLINFITKQKIKKPNRKK